MRLEPTNPATPLAGAAGGNWNGGIPAQVICGSIGGSQALRVRKQVYELTLLDLSVFPVWEFRLDEEGEEGRDESTVRPYTAAGTLDHTDRMFIVRAVFILADGSKMLGYFTPPGR